MKNNRKHETPVMKLMGISIALAIIGVVIIHFAYKIYGPEWLASEWSAGDALSYYGALIASIITIYGLYLTFTDNRKGIREQSRLDKLPFLGVTMLEQYYPTPISDNDNSQDIQTKSRAFGNEIEGFHYTEIKPDTIFCIIEEGKTVCKRSLPKEKLSLICYHGIEIVHVANGLSLRTHHSLLYVPLEVTNVGNGAAIDLHFGFNKLNGDNRLTEHYTPPVPLKTDNDLYIAVYADNKDGENCGRYLMEYYYKDIFGNLYLQKQIFELGTDFSGCFFGILEEGMQQKRISRPSLPYALKNL